jgi:hypothetical protein
MKIESENRPQKYAVNAKGILRRWSSKIAAGGFLLSCTIAFAAENRYPPAADLIGRWERVGKENWLMIDYAPNDSRELVVQATKGEWKVDPDFDPAKGVLRLNRFPTVDEMVGVNGAPQWACEKVQGDLQWQLRLYSAKGKTSLKGLVGDQCNLTLKGKFVPGQIAHDETTRQARVATGAEAEKIQIDVEYTKKWYPAPTIDERITFSWADKGDAATKLGSVDAEIFALSQLRLASTEKGAVTAYRQFVGTIFKTWTYIYALPSAGGGSILGTEEGFLHELGQNIAENIVGKAIEGDELGREIFIESLAATACSALTGNLVTIDDGHFDAIAKKFGEEFGERSGSLLGEHVKSKDAFAKRLEELFTEQCRFEIQAFRLTRGVSGIMVADKGKHEASLVLYMQGATTPSGKQCPGAVFTGRFNYGEGQSGSQNVALNVNKR